MWCIRWFSGLDLRPSWTNYFPKNIPLILKFRIPRNRNCEFIGTLENLSKLWSLLIFIRDKIQLYYIIKFNRIEYLNTTTFYVNRYGILKKVNCSWTMPMFIQLSRIRISCFSHSRRKKMKTKKRFQANRKIKRRLYVEGKRNTGGGFYLVFISEPTGDPSAFLVEKSSVPLNIRCRFISVKVEWRANRAIHRGTCVALSRCESLPAPLRKESVKNLLGSTTRSNISSLSRDILGSE